MMCNSGYLGGIRCFCELLAVLCSASGRWTDTCLSTFAAMPVCNRELGVCSSVTN